MKILAGVLMLLVAFATGCTTSTANYPFRPAVRIPYHKKGFVFYYRNVVQLPKDAFQNLPEELAEEQAQAQGIAAEVIAGAVQGVVDVIPQTAAEYSKVRNHNAFQNIEIFIHGYTPEELETAKQAFQNIFR